MSGERATLDRLDFPATLMYHLRQMSQEASKDGWLLQFEDCVDLLCVYLRPYMDWAKWEEADKDGQDLTMTRRVEYDRAKRRRIVAKLSLAIQVLHDKKVLFREVDDMASALDMDTPWTGRRSGE